MTTAEGYLTVEKTAVDTRPKYRGVHRMPPFSQEEFKRGFDDPYLFGVREATGLLPSVAVARDFLQKYQELYSAEELEIIFVRTGSDRPPLDAELIGFDVADSQPPFYSFVGDPPSGPDFEAHLERLNENGLFSNVQDAEQYIQLLRERFLRPEDPTPIVWDVFSVE